jgi:hypothetical protein
MSRVCKYVVIALLTFPLGIQHLTFSVEAQQLLERTEEFPEKDSNVNETIQEGSLRVKCVLPFSFFERIFYLQCQKSTNRLLHSFELPSVPLFLLFRVLRF